MKHFRPTITCKCKDGTETIRVDGGGSFDTPEGLYDVAWSERNPQMLVTAAADGSVLLYNGDRAVRQWREHGREVACVDWNMVSRDCFLTSSYDGTIKVVRRPWALARLINSHRSGGRKRRKPDGR